MPGDLGQVGRVGPVAIVQQATIVDVAFEQDQVRLAQLAVDVRGQLVIRETRAPERVVLEHKRALCAGAL